MIERILRVAVKAGFAPINRATIGGLRQLFTLKEHEDIALMTDDFIAMQIRPLARSLDKEARLMVYQHQDTLYSGAARILARHIRGAT